MRVASTFFAASCDRPRLNAGMYMISTSESYTIFYVKTTISKYVVVACVGTRQGSRNRGAEGAVDPLIFCFCAVVI